MDYLDKLEGVLLNIGNELIQYFEGHMYIFICPIVVIIILLVAGVAIDYRKKDTYVTNKVYYRTIDNQIGGGEEYYYRYWIWQHYKKRYLVQKLKNELGISRVYSRRALKKRKNKKVCNIFLREVYGNAR